jgi:hypothetical protein
MNPRHWLARLPFTFLILGAFFLFEAYNIRTGRTQGSPTRQSIYIVAGITSLALGATGLRLRHQPPDQP